MVALRKESSHPIGVEMEPRGQRGRKPSALPGGLAAIATKPADGGKRTPIAPDVGA
jgi:hypothetical protein